MAERNPTIVFPGPKQAVVEDRPVPAPGPGELLVKTRRSLISTGTEMTIFSGEFPPGDSFWAQYGKYPFVAGYSNAGTVVDTGPGVDASWKGKRVASFRPHAAYATVRTDDAYELPPNLPEEQAAFFSISLIVLNGVRLADLKLAESVVVFGAGLIGQFCARFCALDGARPVMVVDVADARLKLVPSDPAYAAVKGGEGLADRVKALTGGRMADVVFECTGNQHLIAGQFSLLKKPRGRFVVLSSPRGASTFDFHDLVNAPSHVILGAHQMSTPEHETPYNPWTKRRNTEVFFGLLARKELDVAGLISHRYPAAQGPDAYRMLLADRSGAMGVVLDWGS